MQEIIGGVEATAAKIAEIAAATVQQASNAKEVSTAIQTVAQVTERSRSKKERIRTKSILDGRRITGLCCKRQSPVATVQVAILPLTRNRFITG